MTTYLRNCWYQAAWSNEVGTDNVLARTILETPLAIFRDSDGRASAILDRCPHRFAPLSAGAVEQGKLFCGYHGLGFDGSGRCIHNPHGVISSALTIAGYPMAERHQALWVWMGDPEKADPSLLPNLSFIDDTPEKARIFAYLPTAANYELLSDNILDLSHADYLHKSSLGGFISDARMTCRADGDRIRIAWDAMDCDPPPAFKASLPPGSRADLWHEVVWTAPAVMVLAVRALPAGAERKEEDISYTLHNMTPETGTSSHYFVCNTRPFLLDDDGFTEFLRGALTQAFVHEDKPMLEKQQARMATPDFWSLGPALFKIDTASVRARRKLEELITLEAG